MSDLNELLAKESPQMKEKIGQRADKILAGIRLRDDLRLSTLKPCSRGGGCKVTWRILNERK